MHYKNYRDSDDLLGSIKLDNTTKLAARIVKVSYDRNAYDEEGHLNLLVSYRETNLKDGLYYDEAFKCSVYIDGNRLSVSFADEIDSYIEDWLSDEIKKWVYDNDYVSNGFDYDTNEYGLFWANKAQSLSAKDSIRIKRKY